jgi:microcystin-dependent protein
MPWTRSTNIHGKPSWTLTSVDFVVPEVGATVEVSVDDPVWAAVGGMVWIENAGGDGLAAGLRVTAKTDTSLTLLNPVPYRESGSGGASLPIGTVLTHAGELPPEGCLICDGSEQLIAEYPELYGVIGTRYGAGDGLTTFNLPDLRDKVVLGVSSTRALGSIGGEETHVISIAEMPVHTHVQNSHGHAIGQYTAVFPSGTSPWGAYLGFTDAGNRTFDTVATNQNAGQGLAHNNMQPYVALTYVIVATS